MRVFLAFLVFGLAATAYAPVASASIPVPTVPVTAHAQSTVPTAECPDCLGVEAGAGAGLPECMDCPAFGAGAQLLVADGGASASARLCYSSIFYHCFVDETITA